jgi:cell division protein FtsW (lipid II flippase)
LPEHWERAVPRAQRTDRKPRDLHGRRHWVELILLLLALAFSGSSLILLSLVEQGALVDRYLYPWFALALLAVLNWGALTLALPVRDPLLLPLVVLLAGWGMIEVARLQEIYVTKQMIWVILGMIVMLLVAVLPYRWQWLSRYRYLGLMTGLGLLLLTIVWGVNPLGAGDRLWLSIGKLFYFQPSELLKLLLVVFLASYLADRRDLLTMTHMRIGPLRLPPLPYLVPLLAMWGFSLLLLVWQQDLGAALLYFGVFLSMLYVATGSRLYVGTGLAMLVGVALVGYTFVDRVRLRGSIWLNPWADPKGTGYQLIQAMLAYASGGFFGSGLGLGFPTPWVPVAHSDFVFAAIAEEWGVVGGLGLLAALLILVARGLRIAIRATLPGVRQAPLRVQSSFVSLLAVGISALLGWQTLVIVGGTLRLIPLTGITLPFVSYGGTSMLISCTMVGLLLRASAYGAPGRKWRNES